MVHEGAVEVDDVSATVRAARDRIRELIRTGAFAATGRLPSERELGASLAVSRSTLRRALGLLADEGVVSASPKSGWFVSDAPLSEPARTLVSFTEMARRRGVEPRTRVLSRVIREATIDEATELMTAPLSPVLELERLRSLGSTPACIDRSVILISRTPGIDAVDLEDTSLYEEMRALGTTPTRSRYGVEAIGAEARDAELLDVPIGSPLLLAAETCYDPIGRALLIGTTRYRAGIYRFYTTMLRR
ncbi:GntR family transcriptional regulator [Herbiconiux sp. L3-i23]|uniref:GntR family transcriptional regulator n=1 Tax=Herbiconiux sp. L3-i23 TaxID=2905871 RepID=UPI002061E81E|nr:GntR family transcriptional regulator [Herbiconiux sp. L3-i23]BDI22174.1 GntR family transcriptional regulator [Herbiconiux sp. L3-i23]